MFSGLSLRSKRSYILADPVSDPFYNCTVDIDSPADHGLFVLPIRTVLGNIVGVIQAMARPCSRTSEDSPSVKSMRLADEQCCLELLECLSMQVLFHRRVAHIELIRDRLPIFLTALLITTPRPPNRPTSPLSAQLMISDRDLSRRQPFTAAGGIS